ncbi:transcription factor TFIIIC subunit TFC6 [Aspergillus tanneri]|uniref:Transcription factor TFIIIC complex subunit Tfc6 n=1 Tax=Aspergillus tanneri TaxID=1220188 RepID=A0A5M9MUI5_9EURO|nr:uncharacterized protein ATNIH1004_007583 [Aspergillus tanneri]KAA8646157.1 hypothetical protein ATNIH1004_007583 [Aspergillus tanneri]
MPRTRRSNRQSGPRTKYTDDPFEMAGVSDESAPEETRPPQSKGKAAVSQAQGSSSDEEFKMADEANEDNPDDSSDDEDDDGDMVPENDGDEDEPMSEDSEPARSRRHLKTPAARPKSARKRHTDGPFVSADDETHSRGSWNPAEHLGKADHFRVTFGTDDRDLLSILHARDIWSGGLDSTFPTRSSLDEAQKASGYRYGLTFGAEPEDLERERTRGWDWYYAEDVGGRIRKRQRIEKISERQVRQAYLPRPREQKHKVFIGPVDDQKLFTLAQHESVDFGEAWPETKDSTRTKKTKRQGWILNMGQRVKCMAWAPNQPGLTQYLAMVAPLLEEQKVNYARPLDAGAPAFSPSAPYPCALQLWAFKAAKDDSFTKKLDMSSKPRLRLTLCTNWGDLKRIAWCPMARDSRDEDDEDALKNIGLLAGIWGDGCVRVIDVKLSRDPRKTEFCTTVTRVASPVFEAKPPSTVCTCVAWLSPSDIAVGCANGFVAVWSIASSSTSPQPLPYFYEPLHSTYILNLTSAYPTYPHLLSTTSMDGDTRLTSLIDRHKNTVGTMRMRFGSAHLSYSPILQAFLSGDENDFARMLAVRRFYTTTAIARLPSTISALAPCSFWHPSLLYGATSGAVVAINPMRRVLHPKEKQWQQTWFTHEWVRGTETNSPGASRFHDGYRAESISLLRNLMGDPKLVNGTMIITIFEEGTHVTALSWNPNQACAGWASAGLGCGLIRIEDLAI